MGLNCVEYSLIKITDDTTFGKSGNALFIEIFSKAVLRGFLKTTPCQSVYITDK